MIFLFLEKWIHFLLLFKTKLNKSKATTAGTSDAQPAQGDSNDEAEKTGVDPSNFKIYFYF